MKDIIIFLPVILIIVGVIFVLVGYSNKYNKNIMETKPKRRFKYIDTFFYSYLDNSHHDGGSNTIDVVFNIVSDLEDEKLYAIPKSSFNNMTYKYSKGKFVVQKAKGHKFINVKIDDEGNFWIDKEDDCYSKEGKTIKLLGHKVEYSKEKSKIGSITNVEPYKLYNLNPKYDIKLLDKVTFVYGLAEFDINE